jgi:hypothetical protein
LPRRHSTAGRPRRAITDAYSDDYAYSYAYSYGNSNTYSYGNSNTYSYGNSYTYSYGNSNSYCYSYGDSYCYTNAYSNADGYAGTGESDHSDRDNLFTVRERHGRDPRPPELQRRWREDQEQRHARCILLLGEGDGAGREQQRYDHSNDHHGQLHRLIRLCEREQCV